jgi:hypothetical protein
VPGAKHLADRVNREATGACMNMGRGVVGMVSTVTLRCNLSSAWGPAVHFATPVYVFLHLIARRCRSVNVSGVVVAKDRYSGPCFETLEEHNRLNPRLACPDEDTGRPDQTNRNCRQALEVADTHQCQPCWYVAQVSSLALIVLRPSGTTGSHERSCRG